MEEILGKHRVSVPLPAGQDEDIDRILAETREFYRERTVDA
jgi:hypothetical protein